MGLRSVLVFLLIIAMIVTAAVFHSDSEDDVYIVVERVVGDYQLVDFYKDKMGVFVSVRDKNTNKLYQDYFVSKKCLLINSISGTERANNLKLIRFTEIGSQTGLSNTVFKGLYEQLCTNVNYEVEKDDNYLK